MLTEIYIEALLVDEESVNQIWKAWDEGEIDDLAVVLASLWMAYNDDKEQQEKSR